MKPRRQAYAWVALLIALPGCGSKQTHARRLERLKEAGFTDAELARIHGPIGLRIGAKSVAEIAVSVLGEMTATLRG